jgi:hypothetical protein
MAERAFLKRLINSYGKTWHTWHTGRHDGAPGHGLPLGDPKLMWSFNRDGECEETLIASRDETMGICSGGRRERRQELVKLAHPQCGVDAMAGQFRQTRTIEGVGDSAGEAEPQGRSGAASRYTPEA